MSGLLESCLKALFILSIIDYLYFSQYIVDDSLIISFLGLVLLSLKFVDLQLRCNHVQDP